MFIMLYAIILRFLQFIVFFFGKIFANFASKIDFFTNLISICYLGVMHVYSIQCVIFIN